MTPADDLTSLKARLEESEAACAAMRRALETLNDHHAICPECGPLDGIDEDGLCPSCGATCQGQWVDQLRERVAAALPSSAGKALLEELAAYREGREAWEALEPAVNRPQRFYGEKAYERLRLAQARVEALKGGTT